MAERGDASAEGASEGSSGDGELLSPLEGEGRAWRAMEGRQSEEEREITAEEAVSGSRELWLKTEVYLGDFSLAGWGRPDVLARSYRLSSPRVLLPLSPTVTQAATL